MAATPQEQDKAPAKPKGPLTFVGNTARVTLIKGQKVFGSDDDDFINGLVHDIINIASPGKTPDDAKNGYVASIILGIDPQDQIEAMLATQMAAVHMATMTFSRRLAHVESIPQQDSAERALNKLARTFTTQMEALKRYRSSGQQVVVKHVNVNEGGQAIVGHVTHGGQDA